MSMTVMHISRQGVDETHRGCPRRRLGASHGAARESRGAVTGTGRGLPGAGQGRRRLPVTGPRLVWWLVFGTVSVYWAAGGMRLVDTAVQERGVELVWMPQFWVGGLLVLVVTARLGPGTAIGARSTR